MLEREIAGEYNTFLVYLFMLRVKEASGRKVAQELGFSSPALAVHHLEKLSRFKLVEKTRYGAYHVVRRRFGLLRFFVVLRKFIVPRTFFYTIFYAAMFIGSFLVFSGVPRDVALFFSLIGMGN